MDKKIIYKFIIVTLISVITVSLLTVYNSRNSTLKAAIHNAEIVSNVVKNGLTSYMINGNTHELNTFLNSVSSMKHVNNLWIVRGDNVVSQFGDASDKKPKDDIDRFVIKTGTMKYQLQESIINTTMRITIPYKAVLENGIDCLKCHKVSHGDTLGAISMELDISDIKEIGLENIYYVPTIVLISLLLLFLIFKNSLGKYRMIFENLTKSLNLAILGKYRRISYPGGLTSEMIALMEKFNNLMTTFKATSEDIDKKLKVFIGSKSSNVENPLEDSKEIVANLSNLYQFKKEIELDNSKEEIYNRLSEVFINQFNIKNFAFVEIDVLKKKREILFEVGEAFGCGKYLDDESESCRAARTKHDVISVDYHHSCQYFKDQKKFHYCISADVGKNVTLVINFVCETKEELEYIKDQISYIKSYINEATPSIEVKLLMNALQESAFRDGLTGLYNRKFLDEHTKKLLPHAKRDGFNIGVLLLDMDHFKAVNDEYGHDIGDKVLRELARILTENVRESDLVVRYGGEEFIVLLVNVANEEDAMMVANKIRNKVAENEIDVYAGSKLRKTISIGLSMYPNDSTSLDSVIKNADIALYEAKHKGRNQVIRFKEEQTTSVELF